jgi:hypothetical protein
MMFLEKCGGREGCPEASAVVDVGAGQPSGNVVAMYMQCSGFCVLVQPVATATARGGLVHYVLSMMFRHEPKTRRRDSHEALWFSDGT